MSEDERQLRKRIGRRAANKIINRRKIISSAKQMIEDAGIMALSPAKVAEAADVGHGTFYSYFPDSEALIEAVIDEAKRDMIGAIVEISKDANSVEQAVKKLVESAVDYAEVNPRLYQLITQNMTLLSDRFVRQVHVRMEISGQVLAMLERFLPEDDNERAYEAVVDLCNKIALMLPAARPGSMWDKDSLTEQAIHYLQADIDEVMSVLSADR